MKGGHSGWGLVLLTLLGALGCGGRADSNVSFQMRAEALVTTPTRAEVHFRVEGASDLLTDCSVVRAGGPDRRPTYRLNVTSLDDEGRGEGEVLNVVAGTYTVAVWAFVNADEVVGFACQTDVKVTDGKRVEVSLDLVDFTP